MNADDPEVLIEAAASAFRERDAAGRVLRSPAWFDLAPEQRDLLFDTQLEIRAAERLIHPAGLSGTARAVLARLYSAGQERPE